MCLFSSILGNKCTTPIEAVLIVGEAVDVLRTEDNGNSQCLPFNFDMSKNCSKNSLKSENKVSGN